MRAQRARCGGGGRFSGAGRQAATQLLAIGRLLGITGLVALELSCAQKDSPAAAASVPEGSFAVVGERALDLNLLGVARGDAGQVARGIVHDELFSQQLRMVAPERAKAVERGVLSRGLLEAFMAEERRARPVTEQDLKDEKARRWVEYDRPRSVRVAAVFFEVAELSDDRPAYAVAERVYAAIKDAKNPQQFADGAQAAAGEKDVGARIFPPVAADGRVVPITADDYHADTLPPEFGAAAAALKSPGDISGIVGTKHGFHILFAMEIFPEHRPSLDQVRSELEGHVIAARVDAKLAPLRTSDSTPITRVRDDIATLLRQVEQGK